MHVTYNYLQKIKAKRKKQANYDGDASNDTRILPSYSQPVSVNNYTIKFKKVKK